MKPAALSVLALVFLFSSGARAEVARRGQPVMGTILTVTVVAKDAASAAALAEAVLEEARRQDDALTIWRADGELAKLNASAGQGPRNLSLRLRRGLEAMLEYSSASRGAFDPATGALPERGDASQRLRGIREVLELDGHRAVLAAGAALDPGAIGKGLALDAAAKLLREGGAEAAFLDFGGSSQTAIGRAPAGGEGWPVLLAGLEAQSSHGVVELRDESLSTSRAGAVDTRPILDPRSRLPVAGPRLVTVRSPSATAADAWSTALVVLGREGLPVARPLGVEALLEDGGGVLESPRFRQAARP